MQIYTGLTKMAGTSRARGPLRRGLVMLIWLLFAGLVLPEPLAPQTALAAKKKSSSKKSSGKKSSGKKSSSAKKSQKSTKSSKKGKKRRVREVPLSVPIEPLQDPYPAAMPPSNDEELSEARQLLRKEYQSARSAFNRRDYESARPRFQALLEQYPAMRDYLLRDLGRMTLLDEEGPGEPLSKSVSEAVLGYGDQLLGTPGTVLIGWGHYLRGRGLLGLGRLEEAESAFSVALASDSAPSKELIYYYYGQVCESASRSGDAYVHYVFASQLGSGSLKQRADAAARRVSGTLDPAERGIDWYLKRDELARLVKKGADRDALRMIQDARKSCNIPEIQTDLRRLEGYCYLRLARHEEAETLLLTLMDEELTGGRPSWETIELLQKEMGRRGDAAGRQALLRKFIQSHPTDEGVMAFFIMASLLKDEGKQGEAEALYQQVVDLYPSRPEANEAAWLLAWARIRRDEYRPAIEALDGIASRMSDGSEEEARARYWLARMRMIVGEKQEALVIYEDVAKRFVNTYYGAMAEWKIQGGYPRTRVTPGAPVKVMKSPDLATDPALLAQKLLFPGWKDSLAKIASPGPAMHLEKAKELWLMQSSSEAIAEIQAAIKHPEADPQTRWMGAALRHCIGYNLLSSIWYGHFFLAAPMDPQDVTPERLALAFPMPYRDAIVRHAVARGLEPALVAALIQQESTFRATIRSPVGAAGLMQVMPYTGKEIAQWLDIQGFQPRHLLEPDFNLRLGTEYMRAMLEQNNGSLVRTLASYNAGPAAVSRWVKRFGELEDDYLAEEIPYKETRTYVRRVLRNFHGYLRTYQLELATAELPHPASEGLALHAPRP